MILWSLLIQTTIDPYGTQSLRTRTNPPVLFPPLHHSYAITLVAFVAVRSGVVAIFPCMLACSWPLTRLSAFHVSLHHWPRRIDLEFRAYVEAWLELSITKTGSSDRKGARLEIRQSSLEKVRGLQEAAV